LTLSAGTVAAVDPLTYLAMFLNAGACVLFYLFKSQRRFPCAALGWTSIVNVLICFYSLAIIEPLASYLECRATLFIEAFLVFVLIGCNNVLAVILLVTIRLRRAMDTWAAVILSVVGVFVPALAVCLVMGFMPFTLQGCTYLTPYLYIAVVIGFFCLLLQLCLILVSLRHVKTIITNAKSQSFTKHDRRLYILTVRLILVYVCQLFGFFPVYLAEIVNPRQVGTAVILKLIGGILSALVLTATNRPLMRMMFKRFRSDSSSSEAPSSAPPRLSTVSASRRSPSITDEINL